MLKIFTKQTYHLHTTYQSLQLICSNLRLKKPKITIKCHSRMLELNFTF